ncbi:MAG: TetR/AcrR family transcriptional regulator [Bacteroidota bacterium]|nr:TetR/AcrR family transcriptional regulator [Bacteroidota bacterium]
MDYKQRIIEEASQMFRTYGIRSVTMDMLASRMGISKRTIYEVFRDKDELLHGVLKWMRLRQQEIMKKLFSESENIIEAIFKMLKLMSDHFSKMSPAFQLDVKKYHQDILNKFGERNELPYYSSNSEILKRGIDEGVFRKDIDLDITNKCLLEVVKMSYDENVFPSDSFLNRDVIKNFYINYLRGISTPKGLELIDRYQNKEII